MNRLINLDVLVLLILLTSCNTQINVADEKQAVKDTLTEMWDAIEQEDVERYATYIHENFSQFGETDTTLNVGKRDEVEGVREWVKTSDGIHTEMIDPIITLKDNVAWITYYWSDQGTTAGKPFASKGKSTRIFVKENGRWLCIHGHYTLLPDSFNGF